MKTNPHLRTTFILDYHRATRLAPKDGQPPSTAHLLLPLLEEFGEKVEVWLYRSPKLRGVMEKIVPERFDEGWGTWHGKWYGVDDEVVLSGCVSFALTDLLHELSELIRRRANLATSYFSNRQDRYIHFHNHPSLLSYLSTLTRLFTHYSYSLTPSPPITAAKHNVVPLPSPAGAAATTAALTWPVQSIHPRGFSQHALATLTAFQNSWKASNTARLRRVDIDTWFWPVLQAGVLGLKEEEVAMARVWQAINESYEDESGKPVGVDLTSGYFGLYKEYKKAIIKSTAPVRVIAASPKVGRKGSVLNRFDTDPLGEWVLRLEGVFKADTGGIHPFGIALPSRCSGSWPLLESRLEYGDEAERVG